ncbi:hypothetical protein BU25DRAFT_35343 [Macroventuria anomochaeta]|uniref:Uncharacterized protein n=1 Tax=Macroventuria anomochaeta TaxID=301207 RepID=A0ACB6S5L2_9PLEO|nr:uncharacterized protein BU25DRAFT_35343 [Macroventuria anomochaeta]KAF2628417.1 hypothetical protein BU25DRAFT_35343 [Macroventuria anomochaeta]
MPLSELQYSYLDSRSLCGSAGVADGLDALTSGEDSTAKFSCGNSFPPRTWIQSPEPRSWEIEFDGSLGSGERVGLEMLCDAVVWASKRYFAICYGPLMGILHSHRFMQPVADSFKCRQLLQKLRYHQWDADPQRIDSRTTQSWKLPTKSLTIINIKEIYMVKLVTSVTYGHRALKTSSPVRSALCQGTILRIRLPAFTFRYPRTRPHHDRLPFLGLFIHKTRI